jgi:hypothetical protein
MKEPFVKVGFLVAYDWYLLRYALPLVYAEADVIWLALDKQQNTWAGNHFEIDKEKLIQTIEEIDINKKIYWYEDDFYKPELSPMQCEVRERNLLAEKMGAGGWHIQLDADEYFLNFKDFITYLKKLNFKPEPQQKAINVVCNLIQLFKKTEGGYLYIYNPGSLPENVPVATNFPHYEYGRRNSHFNHISPFYIIHQTWAREEKEIEQKIQNWGHKNDFDIENYFSFWKKLSDENFGDVKEFHPVQPETWQELKYFPAQNINELITNFRPPKYPLSRFQLLLKNNRNLARIKSLTNKLWG